MLTGTLAATAGFVVISAASGATQILVGVLLASASAGLCWAPFNKAVEQIAPLAKQARTLSTIAAGTSIGIMLAAALYLGVVVDLMRWAVAWMVFAGAGVLTTVIIAFGVPGGAASDQEPPRSPSPSLWSRNMAPLYAAAFVFGFVNAIFFSFAADRVVSAGGLPGIRDEASSSVIFLAYGFFGLSGVFTGRLDAVIGLPSLLRLIFAAAAGSLLLMALAPTNWLSVIVSSGLQGAALMALSATISFWSLGLFPGRGTRGFTAALFGLAGGSAIGPAIAGTVSDWLGPSTMFAVASVPAIILAAWPFDWMGKEP